MLLGVKGHITTTDFFNDLPTFGAGRLNIYAIAASINGSYGFLSMKSVPQSYRFFNSFPEW